MNPRLLVVAAGCTFAIALTACSGGSSKPKASPTPSTPSAVDVIAQWVHDNRNVDFVGDCDNAKQGVDIGKLCVRIAGRRGTLWAYNLGPTFSDPTALAMLQQQKDGTWKVLSVTNRDPSSGDVPGIAWPLEIGDQVVVVGLAQGDCLNVRDTPSTKGKQIACVPQGTKAIIQDGPQQGESYTWWKVSGDAGTGGFAGWAADKWMRLPEAIAQALQPQATPTPGG